MELKILGPLIISAGNRELDPGGPRQRTILAMLAMNTNRVVSIEQLIDAVWDSSPPSTARTQIQICVSALRKVLAEAGRDDAIITCPPGYSLGVDAAELDSEQFTALVQAARAASDAGRTADAAETLRRALALWRGSALAGVRSSLVRRGATWLDEQYNAALELRISLDLTLGRHLEVSAELQQLSAAQPLRERLHCQLMLALYRSGRQAEALAAYRRARDMMVEDFGLEPGPELRELEQAILTRDPALRAAEPLPRPDSAEPLAVANHDRAPSLLPPDPVDFSGRAEDVAAVRAVLAGPERRSIRVVAISGRPGVGKSTLAVRLAHELVTDYPDGQLYADLHAVTSPDGMGEVLARFLRALGVSAAMIPVGPQERLELYRTKLAGTRTLVVLDEVTAETHAATLLPTSPDSLAIVTSRSRMSGLQGVHQLYADVLDGAESMRMLTKIIGAERLAHDEDAAIELLELCAGLPLAIRLAGARLAARPHWRIDQLVQRLRPEMGRLDELRYGEVAVRSCLERAYQALDEQARRLFRLFALVCSPDHPAWVAAALLDTDLTAAEDILESLVDVQLVDAVQRPGDPSPRYRFHELTRIYAHERLVENETTAERDEAVRRVLGGWLAFSEAAHRRDYGGDYAIVHGSAARWHLDTAGTGVDVVGSPRSWWERERVALVAAIRQAADAGLDELCWNLALTLVTFLEMQNHLADWQEISQAALDATTTAGNRRGMAAALCSFGALHLTQVKLADAQRYFVQAAELFKSTKDDRGRALVLCHLASVERVSGDDAAMLANHTEALRVFRGLDDRISTAYVLSELAKYHLKEGGTATARLMLDEALSICTEARYPRLEAHVCCALGKLHLGENEIEKARSAFRRALHIARESGDRSREARCLEGIGLALSAEGRREQAETTLTSALRLATEVGEQLLEGKILYELGGLANGRGRFAVAADYLSRAVQLFETINSPVWQAKAHMLLSEVHSAGGDRAAVSIEIANADRLLSAVDSRESARLRAMVSRISAP